MSIVPRAKWSSRLAFVLAASGSAIGLGNLWKFPYITGINGGGAFVLIYLLCIAAVGIPIFIAELYIGQKAQKDVVSSFEETHEEGTPWRGAGWLGMLSGFLILSFYSVVGGWILDYAVKAVSGDFGAGSEEQIKGLLGELFASPGTQIFWHAIFMAVTIGIVAFGINKGIERAAKILMPTLMVLLGFLLVYSFGLDGFGPAIDFLFSWDASKLTAAGIMEAVGHSFFTLSLGMGAMITYGSYLSEDENLAKTALTVAFLDTAIALLAGVVIFTIVFSNGMEAGSGPSLMFETLPVLFGKMGGGYFVGLAFFLLVAFAAFTSSVSLLEVVVTYWTDTHDKDRVVTTVVAGLLIFGLGLLSALSFNVLEDVTFMEKTWFDLVDALTGRIMLPLGGFFISLFYGWVLGPKAVAATLEKPTGHILCQGLMWSARIVAPVGIFLVLVNGVWPDLFAPDGVLASLFGMTGG